MRIFKTNIIVLCVVLVVAVTASFAALSIDENLAAAQREKPSQVQEGIKTEKQREHGKVISQRYEYRRNKKLSNLRGTGDLQVLIGIPTRNLPVNTPPFNLGAFLKEMICNSDAVLIGEIKNKSAQLTEYGEFVFTDYEVTVEDILKNNSAAPLQPAGGVIVTRPGGLIELNGKVIRAVDESFKPFETGERVLLFLKFIPATGAYQTFSSRGSFKVVGNKLLKLTGESLPAELENGIEAALFINAARDEAADDCDK